MKPYEVLYETDKGDTMKITVIAADFYSAVSMALEHAPTVGQGFELCSVARSPQLVLVGR